MLNKHQKKYFLKIIKNRLKMAKMKTQKINLHEKSNICKKVDKTIQDILEKFEKLFL